MDISQLRIRRLTRSQNSPPMLDRIPERLRTAAEGVERATQMMADAKSQRNQAAEGGEWPGYQGISKESTAEWQGADIIERYESGIRELQRVWWTKGIDLDKDAVAAQCLKLFALLPQKD